MAMEEKCLSILFLLMIGTQIYASKNRYFHKQDNANAEPNHYPQSTTHNVTTDCGDRSNVIAAVIICQRPVIHLTTKGNIWLNSDIHMGVGNIHNKARNGSGNLGDSLDSLQHACSIHQRSQQCLYEHGIRDYCLSYVSSLNIQTVFQFICQNQTHDRNLIRSLQCLRDKQLLVMLYFHILDHCFQGMDILDDLVNRVKNAYLYMLDVNGPSDMPKINTLLYCIPRHVISTCVAEIVDYLCGKQSSELVQNYLLYNQDRYEQLMKSFGISTKICEYSTHSHTSAIKLPPMEISARRDKPLIFVRKFEITAPGTALDTVGGREMVAELQTRTWQEICSDLFTLHGAYQVCLMSSSDKQERTKFNILQFAQTLMPYIYYGTRCLRLNQFTACWNQLQDICGPMTRGFANHAMLFVQGCKIQSEMDAVGCHWQDMLLKYYIQASRVTVWPLTRKAYITLSFWKLRIPKPGLIMT